MQENATRPTNAPHVHERAAQGSMSGLHGTIVAARFCDRQSGFAMLAEQAAQRSKVQTQNRLYAPLSPAQSCQGANGLSNELVASTQGHLERWPARQAVEQPIVMSNEQSVAIGSELKRRSLSRVGSRPTLKGEWRRRHRYAEGSCGAGDGRDRGRCPAAGPTSQAASYDYDLAIAQQRGYLGPAG
jgi:hypothetical protein